MAVSTMPTPCGVGEKTVSSCATTYVATSIGTTV